MAAERFSGRVAVVTGGASPIGFGIARRLAAEGASLVLADIDAARLGDAVERLRDGGSDGIRAVRGDLSRRTDADAVMAAAVDAYGRLDVLVNCAGAASSCRPGSTPRRRCARPSTAISGRPSTAPWPRSRCWRRPDTAGS